MLKRKIGVLIAIGLLGGQAGLAASQSAFPPSGDEQWMTLLPATAQYLDQRAAANPNPTGASGSTFPRSGGSGAVFNTPSRTKYFEEREARIRAESTIAGGASVTHLREAHMDGDSQYGNILATPR